MSEQRTTWIALAVHLPVSVRRTFEEKAHVQVIAHFVDATLYRDGTGNRTEAVVLIHGAFADGSSWDKVIPILQAKGLKVSPCRNPLTSLPMTSRRVNVSSTSRASVILVGHSWGGTVTSRNWATAKGRQHCLVAAFAPDVGESSTTSQGSPPPREPAPHRPTAQGFLSDAGGASRKTRQDLPRRKPR